MGCFEEMWTRKTYNFSMVDTRGNKNLLVLMKHEVLVFKVFGGGLHKLSHFNSRISTLDFT